MLQRKTVKVAMMAMGLALVLSGCPRGRAPAPDARAVPDQRPDRTAPPVDERACAKDDDCTVVTFDQCITTGCSPPCGLARDAQVGVVAKRHAAAYKERRSAEAREKCKQIFCMACFGHDVPPIAPQDLPKPRCEGGRCLTGSGVLESRW